MKPQFSMAVEAGLMKVNETRKWIAVTLGTGAELSIKELCERRGMTQPAMRDHVWAMRDMGLIHTVSKDKRTGAKLWSACRPEGWGGGNPEPIQKKTKKQIEKKVAAKVERIKRQCGLIADWQNAYRAVHDKEPPAVDYRNGWYVIDGMMSSMRESDLVKLTGNLRARLNHVERGTE